jgi:hypothetical protein
MENLNNFRLNANDLAKILKGLSLAMGGAAIVYLLGILNFLQLDASSAIWAGLASTILNILLKLINNLKDQNIQHVL